MAWVNALSSLGYETTVVGTQGPVSSLEPESLIRRAKRTLLPMSLQRQMPELVAGADGLVVAALQSVFTDTMRKRGPRHLVLDWMDLWSECGANVTREVAPWALTGYVQAALWKRREKQMVRECNINTFAGYGNYIALRELNRQSCFWLPTPADYSPVFRPNNEYPVLGFIGNLNYLPNELSLRAFLKRYSSILQTAGLELVVAGYGSERVGSWGYPVRLLGAVDDVDEFYSQIDAAIAPIEHGSGIKVKVVEAFSRGVPVFATAHVRDGFPAEFHKFIFDMSEIATLAEGSTLMSVPPELFQPRFSQEAFTYDIGNMLSRLEVGAG